MGESCVQMPAECERAAKPSRIFTPAVVAVTLRECCDHPRGTEQETEAQRGARPTDDGQAWDLNQPPVGG